MKKVLGVVLAIGMLAILAAPAVAEDIQPPPWRGLYSTTLQGWEFLTPTPGTPAELLKPDWGQWLPSTGLVVTPGPGMTWMSLDPVGNREGVWPLSGWIDVIVDNHEPPNEFKWVWVQLTWRPQDQGEVPIFENLDPAADPRYPVSIVEEVTLPDGWLETTYQWRIYPNPVDELFRIRGTINVDELVIDTWCIPEPSTVAMLLGIGLLGLAALARRR